MGFLAPREDHKPDPAPPTVKRPGEELLFEISYAMAYFILPHYAFKSLQKAIDLWVQSPRTCPTFFYLTTCQVKKCDSNTEEATKFTAHQGKLDDKRDFYLMQHPTPPKIDLTGLTPEQLAAQKPVLAPFYTAIVVERATKAASVFVLGQAPTGGGVTVRQIGADGSNAKLADGPQADISQFLSFVRSRFPA
ncbi:MAG: hypothetical protein ACREJ2_05965 [Planctomycetota bacterium]